MLPEDFMLPDRHTNKRIPWHDTTGRSQYLGTLGTLAGPV